MNRNLDIDDFERLLKDRSDEFKLYPAKRVWHSIYNNIHPGKKWPSIAMCITLISILMLVGYLNTSDTDTSLATTSKTSQSVTTPTYTTLITNTSSNKNFDENNFTLNNNNNPLSYYNTINKLTFATALNFNKAALTDENINDFNSKLPDGAAAENETALAFNNRVVASNNPSLVSGSKNFTSNNHSLNFTEASNSSDNIITGGQSQLVIANSSTKNPQATLPSAEITESENIVLIDAANKQQEIILLPVNENGNVIFENDNIENLKAGIDGLNSKTINANAAILALAKNNAAVKKEIFLSDADKAWIENYALYNKPGAKKWAGKLGWQLYITPSVVYRNLKNAIPSDQDINKEVVQHPSVGLEIGAGIIYPVFKGVKIKTGLQLNFTRYNTDGYENSHPVATSITLSDKEMPGRFYQEAKTTPYSNYGGITPVKLHNETYQLSIPMGIDFKIAGNDIVQWNVGSTIQPSFVFGGKSYLMSSDKRNFIKETSLLNRFNLDAGFETFISYKLNGFTLQIGPQFRKQLFTTNSKTYTVQEKLNTYGIKFGITKLIK